jgi:MFS family permease
MNCSAVTAPAAHHVSANRSFLLFASITVSFLASSSAPTPLYALYQAAWGFSPIMLTAIFAVYALAVLASLLVAGRLSDHLGRRPVLITAIAVQALTMLIFATANGVAALVVARIVQGLAAGAALAAVGAALLDLDKTKGATANAIAPMLGTGTGALIAGLCIHFLPAPTKLVFLALFAVFVVQGIGVALADETISPRRGALASLRPTLHVPPTVRAALLLAAPALVATWALAGFYASLGPTLVRSLIGHSSALAGGLALFVMALGGIAAVSLITTSARRMMVIGVFALFAGVAITLVAVGCKSLVLFFAGIAVAGVGFGAGFQGALRIVVPLAQPHERAGVLSVIFVISYVAMGLPAVLAGCVLAHLGNIESTARDFGAIVMMLSALAAAGSLRLRSA